MLDPDAHSVFTTTVREDVELTYVQEGVGGVPLLLIHGWPESKRIWWHNIEPLAAAGFEVIAPDLRGFADSPSGRVACNDIAVHSRDMESLLRALGHGRCVTAGADWGGAIAQDLSHRFPDLVDRQVLFNTLTPVLPDEWEKAGVGGSPFEEVSLVSDHLDRHGNHADELAAELDSEEKRRAYVREFYLERPLSHPAAFDRETAEFMAQPFSDEATFRTSLGMYEAIMNEDMATEPPLVSQPNTIPTMALFGESDKMSGDHWTRRMQIGCTDLVGPYVVERAGHFLQFEQAHLLNQAIRFFALDLLAQAGTRKARV